MRTCLSRSVQPRHGDAGFPRIGNYGIRKVASTGTITVAAGYIGSPSYSGDGGPATDAQLFAPGGLATDAGGNVYISDTFNNRVRAVSPAGIITTIAGNGIPAYSGDGSSAASSEVYYPVGVAADSLGNLYIADHGNGRIRKISNSGIITSVDLGSTSVSSGQVWGVAVDSKNNLYVPDPSNNRINRISPDGTVTTVAGNGTFGFSGDGGPATSAQIQLTFKAALTTDSVGNLYFSDDNFQPPGPGIPGPGASTPRIRKVACGVLAKRTMPVVARPNRWTGFALGVSFCTKRRRVFSMNPPPGRVGSPLGLLTANRWGSSNRTSKC